MTHHRVVASFAFVAAVVVAAVAGAFGSDGVVAVAVALVTAPVAVVAVHGLADRLGGRRFGIGAAAVYVLLPLVSLRYFLASYHHVYLHRVLPDLLGLRATPWFLLGITVAILARFAPRLVLAPTGIAAFVLAALVWGFGELGAVKSGLHESAWSIALVEWLPVAGFIGAARRSPSIAVGLGGWLTFFVLRASHHPVDDGSFWRALAPALPAAAVLVAAVALLLPTVRRGAL